MPRPQNKPEPKGFVRSWLAEWPKIAATLTTAFLIFAIPLAFAPVRDRLWPPAAPGYPVICTAEPVWRGGDKRLIEVYLINTARDDLKDEKAIADKLRAALGKRASGASTAVFFPFLSGEPRAESVVADKQFNEGKGDLTVHLEGNGVRIQPKSMAALAILRANVVFPVGDDSTEFARGAKGAAGMFDLKGPEEECFTRR